MLGSVRARSAKVDGRTVGQANRALVLNLVRRDPELSRVAIARHTGLSRAAVSGIVDHLIRDGLVAEEQGAHTGAVGRRPLRLVFNPAAREAIGVAVDVGEVAAALVDLGGAARAHQQEAIAPHAEPGDVIRAVVTLVRRLLRQAGPRGVLGVGVAVPGMVRWPDGVTLFSPNFGWRDVPLRAAIQEQIVPPVLLDNEVRALAVAEQHFGAARDRETVVFLDVGYGVGGAVLIDGALYRGAHGAAGEMGHNTVEPGGPRCSCGNTGCLEVFASASGLLARAREALAGGHPSLLGALPSGSLSLDQIVSAAAAGDALAHGLLARAATYLGLAVASAVDNWDPELVVLSGPVLRVWGPLFDDLLATEQRSVLAMGRSPVPVVPAALADDAKVVGAATLVIADYLTTLLPRTAPAS